MSSNLYKTINLQVEGMHCTNCVLGVRKTLERDGFSNVDADFTTKEVRFDATGEDRIDLAIKRIESLGYKVTGRKGSGPAAKRGMPAIEKKFWISAVFTLPLVLAMFIPVGVLHHDLFQLALTIPVFIIGFFHFGRSAFFSLRSGVANMDVLIFLGSTAAFVYSLIGSLQGLGHDYMFYETSASIITIVLLGNMLEHRSVKKTTSAIDELLQLQQQKAKRIVSRTDNGQEIIEEVDAGQIRKGDAILVNPGDGIPVDGEIYWGHCSLDESMISGESLPVDKVIGDRVIGGTLMESGHIRMRATAVGSETMLSQIIEMVRQAQKDKPALQNLADKISMVFVPVVVVLSVLTIVFWFFGMSLDFQDSLMRGIAVLVIACPCALGLAIPTAVAVGLGRIAKGGVLMRGGSSIDKMAAVDTIVFDKTGTLTTGQFQIRRVHAFGINEDALRSMVYSLEKHSSHPIAKAIVAGLSEAEEIGLDQIEEQKGLGISGIDKEGNRMALGSYSMVSHLTGDDTHPVYVMKNDRLVGWLDLDDEIKPDAVETIRFLKSRGLKTILLSGDRKKRCEEVAGALGIEIVYAEKLPHQKLEIIRSLSAGSKVAMVGDGINDAPAMAAASIGISMSDATQVAVKSAEVVLLKGNLRLLREAFSASYTTLRTIKENLFWAFFYNVAAIPLAMAGLLMPIIAAAAMAASDVIVIANSLRLKRRKLR